MKECGDKGCHSPQFGGGYCKYHQYKRKMQGGDLHKTVKKVKPIKPKSEKRKRDEIRYKDHCTELTQEIKARNNGKIFCFFSGEEITGTVSYHHLRGRTGAFYLDKENLVPCLNGYHLEYHFTPVDKLAKEFWYDGFLSRLKIKAPDLWQKEINKSAKSNKINPEIDFDEDLF